MRRVSQPIIMSQEGRVPRSPIWPVTKGRSSGSAAPHALATAVFSIRGAKHPDAEGNAQRNNDKQGDHAGPNHGDRQLEVGLGSGLFKADAKAPTLAKANVSVRL